jgi:hypothetical protein
MLSLLATARMRHFMLNALSKVELACLAMAVVENAHSVPSCGAGSHELLSVVNTALHSCSTGVQAAFAVASSKLECQVVIHTVFYQLA